MNKRTGIFWFWCWLVLMVSIIIASFQRMNAVSQCEQYWNEPCTMVSTPNSLTPLITGSHKETP